MIGRAAIALLLAAEALAFYTVGEVLMRIFPEGSNELVSAPGFVVVAFVAFLTPVLLDWFAVEGGKRAATIGVVGLVVLYGALRLQYAHDFALWDFGWAVDFVLETGTLKEWIPPVVTSSILLSSHVGLGRLAGAQRCLARGCPPRPRRALRRCHPRPAGNGRQR